MTALNERKKDILQTVIEEYIKNAVPVSSDLLKNEGCFDCSPATIRLELAELTEEGFLLKPYVSGGRIPTDRGYRFFVDELLEASDTRRQEKTFSQEWLELFSHINDDIGLYQQIAKGLAKISSNLGFVDSDDFGFSWKEGWGELIKEPEFNNIDYFKHFTELINEFENEIKKVSVPQKQKIMVLIGEECPFKTKGFSMVIAQPIIGQRKLTFAIIGPKRMDFKKNMALIESLFDLFIQRDGYKF